MRKNDLKILGFGDKMRNHIRKIFGYVDGEKFINNTRPYIKKYSILENAKIADIEEKLHNVLSENEKDKVNNGLSEKEAIELLEWVVQRDRQLLNIENNGKIQDESLLGCCGFSQGVVYTLFEKMGLKANVSNINPTISGKGLGGHAFNTVSIPIKDKNGNCYLKTYLIDATFRQFFLRDEVSVSGRFIKDKSYGNKVAPLAGYWCMKLEGGKEFADEILKTGFVELTPKNAKIYGDSFILETNMDSMYRTKYPEGVTIPVPKMKKCKTGISGEQYIKMFLDPKRQDYRGIDFEDGELDQTYGEQMKTPLILKEEQQINGAMKNNKDVEKAIKIDDEKGR